MAISAREKAEVEKANAAGRTAAVFIHGLWLLPSSWDRLAEAFEAAGYAAVKPDWPDDPATVEEARANPDVFAKKTLGMIADHTAEVIAGLEKKPVVLGHSTGGLLAQIVAGRGLSAATVAIDPGPFRGVLPLPLSALKSAKPVLQNRSTAAARSPSPSTSSSTGGPTRSTTKMRKSFTRPSTSPPLA